MIVGFPGETEADFEATCRVVSAVGFCKVHVFPYSQRAGTPAAHYLDQIHPSIISDRRERLLELGATLAARYHRELVGRRLDVMVEGEDPKRPGYSRGTSCRYVPVSFPGHAPALYRQSSIRGSRGGQRRWRYRLRRCRIREWPGYLVAERAELCYRCCWRDRNAASKAMRNLYQHIAFEQHGEVYCVRLLQNQLDENGLERLNAEITHLIDEKACRKLVLSLGPDDTLCLYSVFLAKLVKLQRYLAAAGGSLALAGLSATTYHIFQVSGLAKFFTFYPDVGKAVAALDGADQSTFQ